MVRSHLIDIRPGKLTWPAAVTTAQTACAHIAENCNLRANIVELDGGERAALVSSAWCAFLQIGAEVEVAQGDVANATGQVGDDRGLNAAEVLNGNRLHVGASCSPS